MERFREFTRGKTRFTLGWVFVIAAGLLSQRYPQMPGIALCFVGALIRFWSSGHIRKDSRPAIGGPYSFVRNPLYLGTYLMASGMAFAIGSWTLFILGTVIFVLVYHFVILDEEEKLVKIFNDSYIEYCKYVPRFFPNPLVNLYRVDKSIVDRINPEPEHRQFTFSVAMKNKAYEAIGLFFVVIAFMTGAAFIWQNFILQ